MAEPARASADLASWLGRVEERTDVIEPMRTEALRSALGDLAGPDSPGLLPPLHHWLYFWDVRAPDGLGPDGHPRRGGFLPPITLPRRMWAGGRLELRQPLRLGEPARRVSTISRIEPKSGRSGELVFVTIRHEISGSEGVAIIEEQDLVYRDPPHAGGPLTSPEPLPSAEWSASFTPDPVLLFRYSALTMNGHRIHYDHPYATEVEGYDGLVVHGPLQATLLIGLAERELGRPIGRFEFRALSAVTDAGRIDICGRRSEEGAELWTIQAGRKCFSAQAFTGSKS